MDATGKGLPIGVENFEELRQRDLYYVDKTRLIADLLNRWSKVTLITRPRRFGKTLNMSMLKSFFSMEGDKSIFDGLAIAEDKELCEKHMGRYPVISVSLKSIYAEDFDTAYRMACDVLTEAAYKVYLQVYDSDRLLPADREKLNELMQLKTEKNALYGSLYTLSDILRKHFGRKVVILIDEYDVPLAKAWEQGYYDSMVMLIRSLFEKALKTNDNLEFAVLTGCMRISKESIFTGLNNMRVLGIMDTQLDEYFGFTDTEVREMLANCGAQSRYEDVSSWYDGYFFGNVHIYCPWDVVNFCSRLSDDPDAEPESYWLNSSSNSIVRRLIEYSGNATVQGEIERLVNGKSVEKAVRQDLTYSEMYASIDNIWSVLYTTGYLTKTGKRDGNKIGLVIPNLEVRAIFAEQILALFRENVQNDPESMQLLYRAMESGDAQGTEKILNDYLNRTISIRDSAVRHALKENFYHGLLVGILSAKDDWRVESNRESGDGYSDIQVRDQNGIFSMVIEVKYADDESLDTAASNALKQIADKRYEDALQREKFSSILKYGIAFHLKESRVLLDK